LIIFASHTSNVPFQWLAFLFRIREILGPIVRDFP